MSKRSPGDVIQGCLVKIHNAETTWRAREQGQTRDDQIDSMIQLIEGAINDANEALHDLRALRDFRKEYYSKWRQ